MPRRNLAKPFAIAGFILAEIYMLLTVLGPYSQVVRPPPMPIPEIHNVPSGTKPPLSAQIQTTLIAALFFGPFGAIVGTGLGLVVSGIRGDFRRKDDPAT
jgi:hypothetical protein